MRIKLGTSNNDEDSNNSSEIKVLEMSPNTILNPITDEIEWAEIKHDIENIYYSWNTILIDMYQLNVNKDDILNFSSNLDTAALYVKKEDKSNSILAIANLYKALPQFAEIVSNDKTYNGILKTKSFILNAYSLAETNDWEIVKNEVEKANESFKPVIADVEFLSNNSYRVNKTYVLLNETLNSLDTLDKKIFYIHYRNLMEEICELSA
ncbi:MAG: hypothetical protein IKP28_04815 [Clostridia bacterium]|nr:hypothetical protein [Clostridia bacterium]